ncbi:MAG: hypothetical protein FWC47_05165 [Oscillospiraceae bacterium]|nr:hypothetical protein [Oscillospiraceae bacterium]
MDKITLTLKFDLESGQKGNIVIKDVSELTTNAQILQFANDIIAGNTKINGSKPLKLYSCKKAITSEEELVN